MRSPLGSGTYQVRVLLVLDRPTLIEFVKLTLNHGTYTTRTVPTAAEVETVVADWQPQLLILDMDLGGRRSFRWSTTGRWCAGACPSSA